MAKKAAFLTLLILIISATFAAAQESDSKRAEIYPKTMAIHRVYPHQLGYKVEYIKSNRTLGSFYAPLEWFKKSAGYGEIVYGQGRAYPYATFYYKDGKIDHFRLYLIENYQDTSWGTLRNAELTEEFSVDELVIEYQ